MATSYLIQDDGRTNGKAGPVTAEIVFDDGETQQVRFQAANGEDLDARLAAMIALRELEKAARDARRTAEATRDDGLTSHYAYMDSRTDNQLLDMGMTLDQVTAYRLWRSGEIDSRSL